MSPRKIEFEPSGEPSFSVTDFNQLNELTTKFNIPTISETQKILEQSSFLQDTIASQRRIAAIYHHATDDPKSIQTEILLASRKHLPIHEIFRSLYRVENIKNLFDSSYANLATTDPDRYQYIRHAMRSFWNYRWEGDAIGPVLYCTSLFCVAEKRQVGIKKQVNKGNWGLGFSNNASLSVFEGIPLTYVPQTISKIESNFNIALILWRLGYFRSGLSSSELFDTFEDSPNGKTQEQKSNVIRALVAKAKSRLMNKISEFKFEDDLKIDFVDLAKRANDAQYPQKQNAHLEIRKTKDDRSNLSPAENRVVELVNMVDKNGLPLYSLQDIAEILQIDYSWACRLVRRARDKLLKTS